MDKATLLLHPVRMRIVQTLIRASPLTTSQLRERLPDIPIATLYRHVNELARQGVLTVVAETRIRGTTEKTYALERAMTQIAPQTSTELTGTDLSAAFSTFTAGLNAEATRYLAQPGADPIRDALTFVELNVQATPQEIQHLLGILQAELDTLHQRPPAAGRNTYLLSAIVIPTATDHQPPEP